jgi:hypothetical protein
MGYMTLDDFRLDVNSALGGQGRGTIELDRWVNLGYFDVTGAIDFDILDSYTELNTATGINEVSVPADTQLIKVVKDQTNLNNLGYLPLSEYYRRANATTGLPRWFARQKDKLKLHPVPSGVYVLQIVTKQPPIAMAIENDVTVLPPTWDAAVFLLAMHHAWLALNNEQRAAVWLGRAVTYIQSRITDSDFRQGTTGLDAAIPGLVRRLEGMQQ